MPILQDKDEQQASKGSYRVRASRTSDGIVASVKNRITVDIDRLFLCYRYGMDGYLTLNHWNYTQCLWYENRKPTLAQREKENTVAIDHSVFVSTVIRCGETKW